MREFAPVILMLLYSVQMPGGYCSSGGDARRCHILLELTAGVGVMDISTKPI